MGNEAKKRPRLRTYELNYDEARGPVKTVRNAVQTRRSTHVQVSVMAAIADALESTPSAPAAPAQPESGSVKS